MPPYYNCHKCNLTIGMLNNTSYVKLHIVICDLLKPSGILYTVDPATSNLNIEWVIEIDARLAITELSSVNEHDVIYVKSIGGYVIPQRFHKACKSLYQCLCDAGLMPEDSK